ncbi:M43 family zinc metalloprotease [Ferruginibacter sp. HRS2-29]|uniref:M43 family zinc metalloprotease n=1 Tax=Ferruginibacter sp. HRS2-29 TaxID=2487334 RepID=UPI0020CCA6DD|nr:M43 family zinc metalloprotease [Ferruginibacter sp. HRS2-29]MCP9751388.1 T9SS C-terminal target domain-containing protein [Ferruginibacter sp. HRS2-29]
MKSIVSILLLLLCQWGAQAQRVCGTDEYARHMPLQRGGESTEGILRDTATNENIIIPVVVHILYNTADQNISDAQVISQITALNNDYRLKNLDAASIPDVFKGLAADTRINFCLAKVDPNMRGTTGIIHKNTSRTYFLADDKMKFSASGGDDAWDRKKYLNIWVCRIFGRTLGYATPPGVAANVDGVVITTTSFGTIGNLNAPFNKGRTATHEIAHWLGIKHIWGDEDCGDDGIGDTPKQETYNYNCPVFPSVSSCSPNSNGDLFMNFMDLTDDACMKLFTHGQKKKMRGQFAINGPRNSFLNGFACDSSYAQGGPLPIDTVAKPAEIPADPISLFPNPVDNVLNIQCKSATALTGKTALLFTATGQLVRQQTLQSSSEKMLLGQLPAGLYVLQIGERAEKKIFKVIKN